MKSRKNYFQTIWNDHHNPDKRERQIMKDKREKEIKKKKEDIGLL